jgi:CubicO group peptidase (beta-lactamase class C family)
MRQNRLGDVPMSDFRKMEKVGYGYGLGVRTLMDSSASKGPVGEFGWDGAAGAYCAMDPVNHISIFYAQHLFGSSDYFINSTIRNIVYSFAD